MITSLSRIAFVFAMCQWHANGADVEAAIGCFKLSLQSEAPRVVAATPVIVRVILLNTSDAYVDLMQARTASSRNEWTIIGPDGKPAPLTEFGQRAAMHDTLTGFSRSRLGPHQASYDTIVLNRYFDMTLAGTYTISVARWVPDAGHNDYVRLATSSVMVEIVEQGG